MPGTMKYSIHLNWPFSNSFIQYLFSICDVSETVLGMRNVEVQDTEQDRCSLLLGNLSMERNKYYTISSTK